MSGTAQIIRANSRDLPLANNSVDLVVTSPPYFALRSYQDGGEHYAGQIGDEPTPAEFVDSLLEVTRECVRVLKPSGSLWVNLGDKYANAAPSGSAGHRSATGYFGEKWDGVGNTIPPIRTDRLGIKQKSLMGIPWRYAIRCIDDLGLILRAEVIWSKPNGLPESVTDRVRRSHETWFHFTLMPRYFSAVDEVREAHTSFAGFRGHAKEYGKAQRQDDGRNNIENADPALGKLPGSVWTIPTEPLQVPDHLGIDHFAAFPTEWPRRIIQGWSPAGVCVECGEGRRPVVGYSGPHDLAPVRVINDWDREEWGRLFSDWRRGSGMSRADMVPHFPHYKNADSVTAQFSNWERGKNIPQEPDWHILCGILGAPPVRLDELAHQTELRPVRGGNFQASEGARKSGGTGAKQFHHKEPPARSISGEACACPEPTAPTTPGVVLDPFGGTGTTAMVAKALGRHGISVDMSADYCRLAEWRTNDPKQLAKAARKPFTASEKPIDGQGDLLALIEGEAS